jgi:hypothetical protein
MKFMKCTKNLMIKFLVWMSPIANFNKNLSRGFWDTWRNPGLFQGSCSQFSNGADIKYAKSLRLSSLKLFLLMSLEYSG